MKKSEQNPRDLWDTIKWAYMCIMESQKEKRETRLFEKMMAENVLNLKEDKDIQIQSVRCRINSETYQDTFTQTVKSQRQRGS